MDRWLIKFNDKADKQEKENVCDSNVIDITNEQNPIDNTPVVVGKCAHVDSPISELLTQQSILTYTIPKEYIRFKSPLLQPNLNPMTFSGPFPRIESRKGLSYYLASKLEVQHNINLQKTMCTGRYNTMTGTSVIKFDHQNELFAIGGRNGVIRVFHIEDCYKMLQFKCDDIILPVARVKTSCVNISEIKWSVLDSYCIAVSFFSSTQIEIFDLQDEGDPIYEAAYTVDASKSSNAEGYNTFLIVEESVNLNDAPFIVAGSTAGFIRMWNNYSKKKRSSPTWDVLADPQIPASKASPVVGLHIVNDGNAAYLICFNRIGIVCIWDYKDLNFLPLSSSKSPTLLKRFSVWDPSVPLHQRYQLRGLSLPYVKDSNLLALTVDSGDVLIMDISKSLQFSIAQISALAKMKLYGSKVSNQSNDENAEEPVVIGNSSALLYCRELTVFPFSPDSYISCTSRHCTNFLEIVDHFSTKCHYSMNAQSDRKVKYPGIENQYLRKSIKASYTLPGRVIRAERGQKQIIVSDDLRDYICPLFCASSLKLSCNIYLDWNEGRFAGQSNGSFHTVESISAQVITLHEPYEGPSTNDGNHCIFMRTNLSHHPDTLRDSIDDNGDLNKSLIKSIKLPSFPTALAVSEMFPGLIIVGLADDNIAFVGPS
jgi:hypothetical protein